MSDRGLRPPDGELAAGRDETIEPTGDITRLFNVSQPEADGDPPPAVIAEWALWGKDEKQTAYHVLRCSEGVLAADDFREIITRYGLGVKPDLPQYTVCWIPGPHGRPEHIAVGIHELADPDPQRSGGRSRHVGGRVVEYVRLFCVRYTDLAELAPTYAELVAAVKDYQLPAGDATPLRIELPSADQAAVPGQGPHQELVDGMKGAKYLVQFGIRSASTSSFMRNRLLPDPYYGFLDSLSKADYSKSTPPRLTIELPHDVEEPTKGFLSSRAWIGPCGGLILLGDCRPTSSNQSSRSRDRS